MFTGLVREVGRIVSLRQRAGLTVIDLLARQTAARLAPGDSLAVNGICLTVTKTAGQCVSLQASPETRRITTLPGWRVGDGVHLEPALRVGEAVGGHFVLGHVDGVGRVSRVERRGGVVALTVAVTPALCGLLLPKGSIAVDGVSLTLDAGPFDGRFTAMLIPHTLRATRFARVRPGDEVNIELDVLSKAAPVHHLEHGRGRPEPLTAASIRSRGWAR